MENTVPEAAQQGQGPWRSVNYLAIQDVAHSLKIPIKMARIENHKYTVSEAFQECFYIVPDYQREYVWTDKEVQQLLE
ncbi:MAG: hypothetical protein ACK5YO_06380, partial [Planctomyces sp.]